MTDFHYTVYSSVTVTHSLQLARTKVTSKTGREMY